MIALSIALESLQQEGLSQTAAGVDPAWVRRQALDWWSAGFAEDTSLEAFRTILDEMIGLGVVRKVDGHRYTLRSPNLAHLLGTQREIEDELLDANERQPAAPYEALHFRRGGGDKPTVRSPLTAQQEGEVVQPSSDVAIVCGSGLGELEEVSEFFRRGSPDFECEVLEVGIGVGDVLEGAKSMRVGEARVGVVVVGAACGWRNEWVLKVRTQLKRLRSSKRFVRVVFVADPQRVWSWTAPGSPRRDLVRDGVAEVSLRPWTYGSLRRWLDELGIAPGDSEGRDRIRKATGAWAAPLRDFAERCEGQSHKWQSHMEALEGELGRDALWRKRLGLRGEAVRVLRTMMELGEPVEERELMELVDAGASDEVGRVVQWAELLSYVVKGAGNRWELDGLVAKLLGVELV